ncbi:G-protein coupled receptor Mth-like [Nylanderia fulva]|uniref:G-protein coupled receptor Mth-like n=1 Tax=Nylanderia fulva TaxID=613905 RepID=UPI0010FB8F77|nr:G-protein coupled receptor Mth-like [Nylanderia fulva]
MRVNDSQCIPEKMKYVFPNVYEYTNDLMQNESKRVDEFFQLAVYNPCLKAQRFTVGDGYQNVKLSIFSILTHTLSDENNIYHHSLYLSSFFSLFGYFCFMSGYFWLSTMSFNMWRTFRDFSSLQRNVRQSGKKKLVHYAIFAYGCPFVLAIVCVIVVDFVSDLMPKILRPEFEMGFCWYFTKHLEAFILYFHWITTVCIISSICLSISAARNIKRYEKDANFRLLDSESKQYNDNKKWYVYSHFCISL